jgi:hypothetical protein
MMFFYYADNYIKLDDFENPVKQQLSQIAIFSLSDLQKE